MLLVAILKDHQACKVAKNLYQLLLKIHFWNQWRNKDTGNYISQFHLAVKMACVGCLFNSVLYVTQN